MTGGALVGRGIAGCEADQAAIGIMTSYAGIMNLGIGGINQRRWTCMAAVTVDRDLNSLTMIDVFRVRSVKGVCMTSGAVARTIKGFTCCLVDQPTIRIMTSGAGVMYLGIGRIDQRRRIAVAVSATCRANRYNGTVVNGIRMNGCEIHTVTGVAVARC